MSQGVTIHSIAVGLTRTTLGEDVKVGEMIWRKPDLPSRMLFVETIVQLYEAVELPSFPSVAWAEIERDGNLPRVEIRDAVGEPEKIAGALWTWIVTTSQGLS